MNIGLIGYGRMGKEIEAIALDRGHTVDFKIDLNNQDQLTVENLKKLDVVIEFTTPMTAVDNYSLCFEAGVPVVSGTTGWLDQMDKVKKMVADSNGCFFYGSNFSVGVNIFFELNKRLAKMMSNFDQYKPEMVEVHHTAKLDEPSGTAITLAEGIIENSSMKEWSLESDVDDETLSIDAVREGDVPGIHTIKYDSFVDYIEVTHSAKSRKGFAFGAVLAAEFSVGKTGILSMSDILTNI